MKNTVKQEGDYAVIRIPMSEIHGLRVVIDRWVCHACLQRMAESSRTILRNLSKALAKLETGK